MDPNIQQPQQSIPPQLLQQPVQLRPIRSPFPKILLIILGVVIVMGLIGGAYYLGTQKNAPVVPNEKAAAAIVPTKLVTDAPTNAAPDATANWKTYTSPLGYSLQYPSDWILNPKYIDPQGSLGPESISITDQQGNNLVFDYGYRPLGVPPHVFKTENIFIGGLPIVKTYNDGCDFTTDGLTAATASCKSKTTEFYQITYSTPDGLSNDPTVVDSAPGAKDYAWVTGPQSIALGMNNFHGKPSYIAFILHNRLAISDSSFQTTNSILDKIIASIKFTN